MTHTPQLHNGRPAIRGDLGWRADVGDVQTAGYWPQKPRGSRIIVPLLSGNHLQRRWLLTGKARMAVGRGAWMGVSRNDIGSLEGNSGT
jgi:hypothetical protein